MDIFGLMPMTDPLHLVCCNACKKPVKASQYAAHAEICRSLTSAGEMLLDTSGGIGHRRPPRKERKKLLSSYSSIQYSLLL
uniref:SAGA-associated factor 11 n=1 Tax=Rhizophora mucronata TaxID=61149 RepID=A0A2P2KPY9_RHIMU